MNKQEAWRYYKTWMKERTYCKALKAEVRITRKGWDHLSEGTNAKRRTYKDRNSRFQLLKLVKYTIKNSEKFRTEVKHNQKYYVLELLMKKYKLRVLLKKDLAGKFYFYSVMKH